MNQAHSLRRSREHSSKSTTKATDTMNVATEEKNEQGDARRTSSVSIASNESCDENPLMRLVDAAVSASSREEAASAQKAEASNKESKDEDLMKEGETGSSASVADNPSSLEDAKVIRGTVQDLVGRSDKKATFAEYLMECLNDESNHDVLQWMPCGKQFTIVNHRKFTMERMPELFKIRNMSSFVRKLTRWGFSRVHEKTTGNSDIFRHDNFQRDKPELCRKIRCVNRATAISQTKPVIPLIMHPGSHVMGSDSESSLRHPMASPRRSMGVTPSPYGRPVYRYPHVSPHPRVSPEYEKEMVRDGRVPPRAPPVYSPASMSAAAAEYELEQVLLQRQQARLYRERQRGHSPSVMVDGSERSHPDRARYPADMFGTNSVVEAALDTLQREGSVDLDMSPREAMLRAMLHKRQQQRQQQQSRGGGGGILRHGSAYPESTPHPRHPSAYYR
jgi:hypothetical protein